MGAANRDETVFDRPGRASTCGGPTSPTTCPSPSAPTTASAPRWPGSRARSCSRPCVQRFPEARLLTDDLTYGGSAMLRAIQSLPTDLGPRRLSSYRLARPARPRATRPCRTGSRCGRARRRSPSGSSTSEPAGMRRRLVAAGVEAGDRVLVALPNSVRLFEMLIGAARVGAVTVPVNTRLVRPRAAAGDRGRSLRPSSWATRRLLDRVPRLDTERHRVAVGADYETWLLASEPVDGRTGTPDDVVLQIYTSGTSGRPKGVLLTDRNLAAKVTGVVDAVGARRGEHQPAGHPAVPRGCAELGPCRAGRRSDDDPRRRRPSGHARPPPRGRTGDARVPGAGDAGGAGPRGREGDGASPHCARSSTAGRRSAMANVERRQRFSGRYCARSTG